MTDDSGITLMERHYKKFGHSVPVTCWHGSPEGLDRLMAQATDNWAAWSAWGAAGKRMKAQGSNVRSLAAAVGHQLAKERAERSREVGELKQQLAMFKAELETAKRFDESRKGSTGSKLRRVPFARSEPRTRLTCRCEQRGRWRGSGRALVTGPFSRERRVDVGGGGEAFRRADRAPGV